MTTEPQQPGGDPGSTQSDQSALGAGIDLADPNSPLARWYLTTSQVLALVAFALVIGYFNMVPLWHTDVWAHMKFGEWIVKNRQFPDHEPYSPITDKSQPMMNAGWLSQTGYHGLFQLGSQLAGGNRSKKIAGGVELVRFFHQLAMIAMYAVMWVAYRRYARSWRLAAVGLILLIVLTIGLAVIQRPQAYGQLCFATLILILARPLGWKNAILGVPLLVVLWANIHGSFAIGLAFLGITLVGKAIEARPFLRGVLRDAQVLRHFVAVSLATLAVAILNPHGPKLFLMVAKFGSHPNIATVDEWKPLQFTLKAGGQWSFVPLWLVVIATQVVRRQWFKPTEYLWLLVFGLAPLLQQRLLVWWVFLVPAVLLPHWAAIGERLTWKWLKFQSQPNFRKTLIAAVPLCLVLLGSTPIQWLVRKGPKPLERGLFSATPWRLAEELMLSPDATPRPMPGLAQELKANYPNGRLPGMIFCSETLGDYLFWILPSDQPVTAFSHIHLFPPEYWTEFLHARNGGPHWREFMRRYGINLMIFEPEVLPSLPPQVRNDPEWIVILDETGNRAKPDRRARLFVALRKHPLLPAAPEARQ